MGRRSRTSEDAAQKRVSRAVEGLRELFAKRGITLGVSGLVVVISANAVQSAPVGLLITISNAAILAESSVVATPLHDQIRSRSENQKVAVEFIPRIRSSRPASRVATTEH